jgi:AraC family transcriptional regulator
MIPDVGVHFEGTGLTIQSLPVGNISGHFVAGHHLVDVHVSGLGDVLSVGSDRRRPFAAPQRSIGFVPAETDLRLTCDNSRPNLLVWIAPDRLESLLDSKVVLQPLDWEEDPAGFDLARGAIASLYGDGPIDRLRLESLAVQLVSRTVGRVIERGAEPAASLRLKDRITRAKDFAAANLAGGVDLATMAAVACLSPYHFLRAFRATTGETPHAFVMRRRIEVATELLRTTRLAPATVATTCGFSSQAHLTSAFRKYLQTTPARYRSEFQLPLATFERNAATAGA